MQSNPVLEIRNLSKTIGGQKIVENLNLTVNRGDIFGFLGPNGAGKTTTLRLIMHLIFPTSGEVIIDGHSVEKQPLLALSKVGSIIENPAFYLHLTAYQNLKLSAKLALIKISDHRIKEVLSTVGLSNAKNKPVKNFSLGMKQRLGLANALLCSPSLIILDEPTNGVDPQGLRELKGLIKQLAHKENITFLISSHMLREMEDLCNKTAFIQHGKIVEQGLIADLMKSYDVTSLETLFFACVEEEVY